MKAAAFRAAFEGALVSVKSLLLEGEDAEKPTCFVSYSWGGADEKRWVLQLAKDLQHADVAVVLDQWDSRPGSDLGRYIDRVESCRFVVVVFICPSPWPARRRAPVAASPASPGT